MRIIEAALPVITKAHQIFSEGLKVAKALTRICIVGIVATASLIGELTGMLEPEAEPVG